MVLYTLWLPGGPDILRSLEHIPFFPLYLFPLQTHLVSELSSVRLQVSYFPPPPLIVSTNIFNRQWRISCLFALA